MTPETPETPWSPEEGTYPAQQTPIVVNFGPPTNPTEFETDLPSELIHRGWRKFWSQRENRPFFFHQMSGKEFMFTYVITLRTEINVPRTFINFWIFSRPYDLYSGPYVY